MTRIDADPGQFRIACSGYTIGCTPNGLPLIYNEIKERAELVEEIELHRDSLCCLTVQRAGQAWPFIVVALSFGPSGSGFEPGALLVPETNMLFFGAGERILAYRLDPPSRLWEDRVEMGFLGWAQHGSMVLLSGELEFAAWNTVGQKLWTMWVEPPWEYTVRGDTIDLDVMGNKQTLKLCDGPPKPG